MFGNLLLSLFDRLLFYMPWDANDFDDGFK